MTACGILHHRPLRAGRHLPFHRNTGWSGRKGRKKVVRPFCLQHPEAWLPPGAAASDSVLITPETRAGRLGPNQAVSQGLDPTLAAHIPTFFPTAGLQPVFPSNRLFLENRPDPVTTRTLWLRLPPRRPEHGRRAAVSSYMSNGRRINIRVGEQAEGGSEGGTRADQALPLS